MNDTERAIRVLLEGLQGPITVNGQAFNGVMPDFSLTDDEIAAVLSYVRSNFGNAGSPVSPADVQTHPRGACADAAKDRRVALSATLR